MPIVIKVITCIRNIKDMKWNIVKYNFNKINDYSNRISGFWIYPVLLNENIRLSIKLSEIEKERRWINNSSIEVYKKLL